MKKISLFILASLSFAISFAYPFPNASKHFDLTFDNMAAINSTAEVAGTTINVRGFYSPGDGGGGTFYWNPSSSATVVPGMVIQIGSDPGRLIRIYTPGLVNVLWFGAHGDGTTNDAPAFQAAVATANTIVTVPNPAVFYKISSQIGLNKGGVTINGSDKVNTRLIGDVRVRTVLFIGYNVSNITIQNISVENTDTETVHHPSCITAALDTAGDHVQTRIDTNIVIKYCKISGRYGFTDGIELFAHRSGNGGTIRNVVVDHCDFDSLGASGMGALGEGFVEWFSNISMTNNKFRHCGVQSAAAGFGISISGLGSNILADHNYVYDCKTIGIEFAGLRYSTLSNNVFESILSPTTSPFAVPYTVNSRGGAIGINNLVLNNVVKDSTVAFSYFRDQLGFRSIGNVQKAYLAGSTYLDVDSVQGSFTNDKYTFVGSTSTGGTAIFVRNGSAATFSQVNVTGTLGSGSIIDIDASNTTFQNCVFSYTGFIVSTLGGVNNRFLNCYASGPNSNLYDAGITGTTGSAYSVLVHGNDSIRKEVTLSTLSTAVGAGPDSVTTITTGTSSTVTSGTNIVRFNLTATAASYTLTLPAQWHSSRNLVILFTPNGSIPAGSPMITNLTIVAGTGQTLSQVANPVTANAGSAITYRLVAGTIDQRTN